MKRILALVLTLVMLLSVMPLAIFATGNPFTDVPEGAYYYDAVMWAYRSGITTGTTKTKFAPASTTTRGQVVTFLWRALGEPEPETTVNPFEDVKASDYYYKPILWAVEKGITNGTSAKRFSPAIVMDGDSVKSSTLETYSSKRTDIDIEEIVEKYSDVLGLTLDQFRTIGRIGK